MRPVVMTCVLRLHEELLAEGRIAGRVEFVATGEVVTVRSAPELHEVLARAVAAPEEADSEV
jgi:hypothetical protein